MASRATLIQPHTDSAHDMEGRLTLPDEKGLSSFPVYAVDCHLPASGDSATTAERNRKRRRLPCFLESDWGPNFVPSIGFPGDTKWASFQGAAGLEFDYTPPDSPTSDAPVHVLNGRKRKAGVLESRAAENTHGRSGYVKPQSRDTDAGLQYVRDAHPPGVMASNPREQPDLLKLMSETKLHEIMNTHPLILTPDTTCRDAAYALQLKGVTSAPVVDKSGCLIGVCSETDLIWKGAGPNPEPSKKPAVLYIGPFELLNHLRDKPRTNVEIDRAVAGTVDNAMVKPLAQIQHWESLSKAADMMINSMVTFLPVVDAESKLVGTISQKDLLRRMMATLRKTPV